MKQLIFYLENERTLSTAIRAAADAQASLNAAPRTLLITIFSANWTEQAIERTIQEAGDAFPDAILLGSRVPRVIYNGRLSPVGTVISFTFFASAQLRLSLFDAMEDRPSAFAHALSRQLYETPDARALFLLAAGSGYNLWDFLRELSAAPRTLTIFGGLTDDGLHPESSTLYTRDRHCRAGIACLSFLGEDLSVKEDISFGWQPLGCSLTVTGIADPTTLTSLDDRPAGEIYERYLDIHAGEHFLREALTFPFALERDGMTLLRHPQALYENGSVKFGADFHLGEVLHLTYGDPVRILEKTQETRPLIREFCPDALFITSCLARQMLLGSDTPKELRSCQGLAPAIGFYAYGEFVRHGGSVLLSNMTLLTIAMREGAPNDAVRKRRLPRLETIERPAALSHMAHFIEATSHDLSLLNEKLQYQASRDSLTGLRNRGETERLLLACLNETRAIHQPLTILLLDLDDFKHINDCYGHATGDIALRTIANILRRLLRATDIIGRWGGDEFLIVLPNTTAPIASNIGKRIEAESKQPHDIGGKEITLSLSIGITSARETDSTETIFQRADRALYLAKAIPGKGSLFQMEE